MILNCNSSNQAIDLQEYVNGQACTVFGRGNIKYCLCREPERASLYQIRQSSIVQINATSNNLGTCVTNTDLFRRGDVLQAYNGASELLGTIVVGRIIDATKMIISYATGSVQFPMSQIGSFYLREDSNLDSPIQVDVQETPYLIMFGDNSSFIDIKVKTGDVSESESSSGSGASTFTGLSDTPMSQAGQTNQSIVSNGNDVVYSAHATITAGWQHVVTSIDLDYQYGYYKLSGHSDGSDTPVNLPVPLTMEQNKVLIVKNSGTGKLIVDEANEGIVAPVTPVEILPNQSKLFILWGDDPLQWEEMGIGGGTAVAIENIQYLEEDTAIAQSGTYLLMGNLNLTVTAGAKTVKLKQLVGVSTVTGFIEDGQQENIKLSKLDAYELAVDISGNIFIISEYK